MDIAAVCLSSLASLAAYRLATGCPNDIFSTGSSLSDRPVKQLSSLACHADKGKRPVEDGEAGRPSKRAADGAGPSHAATGAGPSVPPPSQGNFTKLGLQAKTIKDLQNVLKAWNLPVSGKKEDLVNRILDQQSRSRGS